MKIKKSSSLKFKKCQPSKCSGYSDSFGRFFRSIFRVVDR
jgi:hypothetical protein